MLLTRDHSLRPEWPGQPAGPWGYSQCEHRPNLSAGDSMSAGHPQILPPPRAICVVVLRLVQRPPVQRPGTGLTGDRPLPKETHMTDTITLTGLVATDPRHVVTSEGFPVS